MTTVPAVQAQPLRGGTLLYRNRAAVRVGAVPVLSIEYRKQAMVKPPPAKVPNLRVTNRTTFGPQIWIDDILEWLLIVAPL